METRLNVGSKAQSQAEKVQRILLMRAQQRRMAQAERIARLKIDEIERRVIPIDELHSVLVEIAAAISTRLRSQPSRLMDRLAPFVPVESHDEVLALLAEESHKLLEELKTMETGAGTPIDPDQDADDALAGLQEDTEEYSSADLPDDAA